jgi:hypothetical protein
VKQVIYALQFRGRAVPADGAPDVIKIEASAPSSTIATGVGVGGDGVRGTVEPSRGGPPGSGRAVVEAEARLTGEHAFHETGTITFGEGGHRLRFRSVDPGYIGPSAEPGLRHGAVVWRVDGGDGQFADASGLITANFQVRDDGDLTVNQFGVLFVPDDGPASGGRVAAGSAGSAAGATG